MATFPEHLSIRTEIDLVFIHGWGMNQGIWEPFCQLFKEKISGLTEDVQFSIKCIDLPGFGTEHATRLANYNIETVSDWLAKKLTGPSIIIGWSMGGLVAQYLASTGEKSLLAHIQIASSPYFVEEQQWPGIKPAVLSIFAKQLKLDHEVLLRRFLALQNMGLERPKLSVNKMLSLITQYPASTVVALDQSLTLLHKTDLRNILGNSQIPCLRIYGRLDGLVSPKLVDKLNGLCIKSETSIIEKASHAPFLSHPEETYAAIASFLQKQIGLSNI